MECEKCKSKNVITSHARGIGYFYICYDCKYCNNKNVSDNDKNIILKHFSKDKLDKVVDKS